jgi:hypothetical protein
MIGSRYPFPSMAVRERSRTASARPGGARRQWLGRVERVRDRLPRRPWILALLEWGGVFTGSLLLGVILTWPLAIHPVRGVYGFGNDKFGGIWNAKWVHDTALGRGDQDFTHEVQYPFGAVFDDRFVQPLDRAFAIVFGGIGDGIFVTNLQTLLSFAIAGPAMYALARYLTGSRPAAALAAVIFTVSPFHLAMAMQYPSLATIQWAPLLVLATLVALRSRRLRDAALVGAALALTWISSYYYGWFAMLFLAAALVTAGVVGLVRSLRRRRFFAGVREGAIFLATRGGVAGATFGLLIAPFVLPLMLKVGQDTETYSRSLEDLYLNAVKPWQYVLPPHDNPVLGDFTRDFIQTHTGILPVYEQSVYLGAIPAALAVLGLIGLRRARPQARYAAPILVVSALFMVLLSLGSAIPINPFSIRAWMDPASVANLQNLSVPLFEVVPIFRYYGRTFIFTSVSVAALAAMGFLLVDQRLRPRWPLAPAALSAALIAVVVFEFNNLPPYKWTELPREPWMEVLDRTPADAPIVDYPVAGFYSTRSYYYLLTQAQHGHPTLNYAENVEGKELEFAVADPDNPEAGRRLSQAGFRYAVVHTELPPSTMPPYQPALPDDSISPNAGAANPWFERFAVVRGATIYRIRSQPAPPRPSFASAYGSGFGEEETDGIERWRWMHGAAGTLTAYVSGPPRPFWFSFRVSSFTRPRALTVSVDGRPVRRIRVPPDVTREVTLPLVLGPGTHDVHLAASPGAEIINDVLHNGDLRNVSVRVTPPVMRDTVSSTVAGFGQGFASSELVDRVDWRWLLGNRGKLFVSVAGPRRPVVLRFEARSFAKARRLTISAAGRRIKTLRLPARSPRKVVVPLVLGPGTHAVELLATPGAVVADDVLHNGDPRALSVRVRAPVVEEAASRDSRVSTASARFGRGFSVLEQDAQGTWRWLAGDAGTFSMRVTGARDRYVLKFAAGSLVDVRRLRVTVDGRVLIATPVPANKAQEFRIPVELGPGVHVVGLAVSPGARRIEDVIPDSRDPRTVSIRVRAPTLDRAPRPPGAFASAAYGYGFATPVPDDPPGWRWLSGRDGTIKMSTTGPRRRLRLSFQAQSFADGPRRLTVALRGRTIASRRVPSGRPIRFVMTLPPNARSSDLQLRSGRGSVFRGGRVFHPDPRKVSIRISAPRVEPAARGTR